MELHRVFHFSIESHPSLLAVSRSAALLLLLRSRVIIFGAGAAAFVRMGPLALQLFDSGAEVERVIARNMAVGEAMIDLVSAAVGDELEVAYTNIKSQHLLLEVGRV